jgi:hypothetical protein
MKAGLLQFHLLAELGSADVKIGDVTSNHPF